jgi:ribosome maturation factor RimP
VTEKWLVRSGPSPTFFVGGETLTSTKTGSGRISEILPELEQIAEAAGCELVHAELKGGALRVFLDKPDGVSLSDCEHVSKQISAFLDVVDFGRGRYVLEVSSPGLDRQLYRLRDYERFAGRRVRVTLQDPQTGRKRTVVARLEGLRRPEGAPAAETAEEEAGGAEVVLLEEKSDERLVLPFENVKLARLEIEL